VSKGRVLIAEDEPTLAWVERFNLEHEGYEVEVADEGQATLDAVERFGPDVLILDVMLPRIDGWSVLESIEAMPVERRPRVILVTAAAGAKERVAASTQSLISFLSKPFDMEDLLRHVADAIAVA
jgi:DNA-binding response OmpR family regulator